MKKILPLFLFVCLLAACQNNSTPLPTTSTPAPSETPAPTQIQSSPTPESTPTPVTLKISSTDGMTQLFVPAGTVKMGGLDILTENDELPAHDVTLSAFWIDQVEVTNGMYGLCVKANVCRLDNET